MDRTDYMDPLCPCDTDFYKEPSAPEPETVSGAVDVAAVMARYDAFLAREQYREAGDFLQKELQKAKINNDFRTQLSINNELLGYHRQYGNMDDEAETIAETKALLARLQPGSSLSAGMILLNIGTALCASGHPQEALLSYSDACRAWAPVIPPRDTRWAGLFNNMAGAYLANGEVDFAMTHYEKAAAVLRAAAPSPDLGLTYVNMAMLCHESDPEDERINGFVTQAIDALNDVRLPHDAYYAHTLRKCIDPLLYLGYFRAAGNYRKEADDIYERNRTGS